MSFCALNEETYFSTIGSYLSFKCPTSKENQGEKVVKTNHNQVALCILLRSRLLKRQARASSTSWSLCKNVVAIAARAAAC